MSFVGPRPEVPEYVDLEDPRWAEILQVRPGLTDPVTVTLRDEEDLMAAQDDRETYYRQTLQPAKLAGYQAYLRERTWKTDVSVIWRTIGALLLGRSAARSTEQGPDLPDGPVGA
jgi:lipopolysaccharide/colanic/teichoic acid biosynthesis glycosyltransferase